MKKVFCILGVTIGCLGLGGCGFWPYKSDFDCPLPKGEQCKSLYEINQMANAGQFAPENKDPQKRRCTNSKSCLKGPQNLKAFYG